MAGVTFDAIKLDPAEQTEANPSSDFGPLRKQSIYGREASTVGPPDRRRSYAEINRIGSVSGAVILAYETRGRNSILRRLSRLVNLSDSW